MLGECQNGCASRFVNNSLRNSKALRTSLTGNKISGDRDVWQFPWEFFDNGDLVYLYGEYLAYNGMPDSSTIESLAMELNVDEEKV